MIELIAWDHDQTKACRSLLATVVHHAVTDACTHPVTYQDPKNKRRQLVKLTTEQFTALRFLFDTHSSGLDAYAMWLDFDPDYFRFKLLETMGYRGVGMYQSFSDTQRSHFWKNYKLWLASPSSSKQLTEEDNDD